MQPPFCFAWAFCELRHVPTIAVMNLTNQCRAISVYLFVPANSSGISPANQVIIKMKSLGIQTLPNRVGLMVETSHPQVTGLDRGKSWI